MRMRATALDTLNLRATEDVSLSWCKVPACTGFPPSPRRFISAITTSVAMVLGIKSAPIAILAWISSGPPPPLYPTSLFRQRIKLDERLAASIGKSPGCKSLSSKRCR